MAKKFAYIHRSVLASTNRFDYPYALDSEKGEVDKNGINHSSNAVPISSYVKENLSMKDNSKGSKDSEDIHPRLYFSDDPKRQVLHPKSIFNDFCAVNYSLIYGNLPELGKDENDIAIKTARYSDYTANVIKSNQEAEAFRQARMNPSIQNIMKYYNHDDPYGLRSYSYTDFAFLARLNKMTPNYMLTLRRYPTPCGDGIVDLALGYEDKTNQLGVWKTYGAVAKAVTYMTKENGNDVNTILKFAYGSNWEDQEADVNNYTNNTTLKSQSANGRSSIRDMVYASRKVISGQTACGNPGVDWYDGICGPLRNNYSDRKIFQGDALATKYGTTVLGPVNCIKNVYIRSRGLSYDHNINICFEYSLKSVAMMNPKAVALDLLANFLTLTGNYGSFWGGMNRFFQAPEELGAPVGDIEKLRNGDILGFASSVGQSLVSSIKNIFSGSAGEIVEKIGAIVAGGFADHLTDIMDTISPLGAANCTKALLRNTPTGNWHLVVGNPLDPIAVIGNLCVESTEVTWGPILQGDDFPSSITFNVSLKHGMPRDIGNIQTMFNAGKGRFYTDIDPKVLEAQKSSNAGTANGYSKGYHRLFGN